MERSAAAVALVFVSVSCAAGQTALSFRTSDEKSRAVSSSGLSIAAFSALSILFGAKSGVLIAGSAVSCAMVLIAYYYTPRNKSDAWWATAAGRALASVAAACAVACLVLSLRNDSAAKLWIFRSLRRLVGAENGDRIERAVTGGLTLEEDAGRRISRLRTLALYAANKLRLQLRREFAQYYGDVPFDAFMKEWEDHEAEVLAERTPQQRADIAGVIRELRPDRKEPV